MTKLEQQIMAGVAAVYLGRLLTSARAIKVYTLFIAVVGIIFFASVPHVVENFAHVQRAGLPAIGGFFLSAVTKTKLVVQIALLVGVVALMSFAPEIARRSEGRSFA